MAKELTEEQKKKKAFSVAIIGVLIGVGIAGYFTITTGFSGWYLTFPVIGFVGLPSIRGILTGFGILKD